MLAQFSVWPLQGQFVGSETARIINATLDQLKVEYEVGGMGTTLTGEWDQVMAAILACHEAVATTHERVLTHIMIDDHREAALSGEEAVAQAQQMEELSKSAGTKSP